MPHTLLRRASVLTLIATGLLVPSVSSGAAPEKGVVRMAKAHAAQAECQNADVMPSAQNENVVRAAILCLHNQLRAQRGLPALRENAKLRRAAFAHSADMVQRGFFEHTAPGGVSMVDRIMAARYASRTVGWALGENLAWGTGKLATPRLIMRAWMDSPGHRANVVKRAYREIGIGVVTGTPSAGNQGATYTADFGVIRK
jgi:uncharacterized protein YkwD